MTLDWPNRGPMPAIAEAVRATAQRLRFSVGPGPEAGMALTVQQRVEDVCCAGLCRVWAARLSGAR
jgi:hypothetical protein